MTELELMANEEARHGNREALERLEAELDFWRKDSAAAWDTCEGYRVKLAQEAYEAQKKAEAERDAAYKRGLEDALELIAPIYRWSVAAGEEVEAAIRAKIQENGG